MFLVLIIMESIFLKEEEKKVINICKVYKYLYGRDVIVKL